MNPAIAPIPIGPFLTRYFAWAGLWLVWAGAVLAGLACGFRTSRKLVRARRKIALMANFVVSILVVRAALQVTRQMRAPRAYGPDAYRSLNPSRAYAGAALRRHFRAPTLIARIAKLSAAVRHPEKLARAIAKRIARNLTKRVRVFAPVFVVDALSAPRGVNEAALDSS